MPTRPATLQQNKRRAPNCYPPRRTERQFATNDPRWLRLRAAVLAEEPTCRECWKRAEILEPANEVDHIDGNPMNNERANLQALCKPCHSRKTMREQSDRHRL